MSPKEFVKCIAPYIEYEDVLFKDVEGCRRRGYLTRIEFLKLCFVKTNRVFNKCKKNSSEEIKYWTKKAFAPGSTDEEKVKYLTELDGIDVRRASFILSAWDPKNYGTIDYRIIEVLKDNKMEDFEEPDRKGDIFWYLAELKLLRKWKKELKLKAVRQVEYTLWRYHFMSEKSEKKFKLD